MPAGDGLQTAVIDASGVIEMWSFGASTSGPEASALLQSSRRIVIMYGDGGSVDVASATPLALPALPLPSLASVIAMACRGPSAIGRSVGERSARHICAGRRDRKACRTTA